MVTWTVSSAASKCREKGQTCNVSCDVTQPFLWVSVSNTNECMCTRMRHSASRREVKHSDAQSITQQRCVHESAALWQPKPPQLHRLRPFSRQFTSLCQLPIVQKLSRWGPFSSTPRNTPPPSLTNLSLRKGPFLFTFSPSLNCAYLLLSNTVIVLKRQSSCSKWPQIWLEIRLTSILKLQICEAIWDNSFVCWLFGGSTLTWQHRSDKHGDDCFRRRHESSHLTAQPF